MDTWLRYYIELLRIWEAEAKDVTTNNSHISIFSIQLMIAACTCSDSISNNALGPSSIIGMLLS